MNITSTHKNIVFNILLQLTTAISGFILPPLLIIHYGSPINGLVSSIKQFIAYLSLVESGIGVASIAALYPYVANKDTKNINQILTATKHFYNVSGIIFSILLLACSLLYSVMIKKEINFFVPFLMFLILGLSGLADFFFIGKYRVLLFVHKKNYVISFTQTIGVIFNLIICIIFINLNFDIVLVQFFSSAFYIVKIIILKIYVKKKFSYVQFDDISDKKALNQRWDALFLQLSSLVVFNSPIIILTIFCDLKDVSVYAVYAMIFTAIDTLLSVMSTGLSANFGELLYSDKEDLIRYFRKYETIMYLFIGWGYSCTILLIKPFLSLYIKNLTDINYQRFELIPLFVFVGVVNKIRVPGGMLIEAAGKFKETKFRGLAEATINIVVSIICTIKFGMIGVLMGGCCSYLYRTIDVLLYSPKYILFDSKIKSIIKIFFLFCLYAVLIFLINTFICNRVYIDSYLEWFCFALLYGGILIVPALSFYLLGKGK